MRKRKREKERKKLKLKFTIFHFLPIYYFIRKIDIIYLYNSLNLIENK